jgi:hypothetical protein
MSRYSATDAEIQPAIESFKVDIARYYCGTNPFNSLINRGAKVTIQLYGKDSGSVGTYDISSTNCSQ